MPHGRQQIQDGEDEHIQVISKKNHSTPAGLYLSHAHYVADDDGVVDLTGASASGGTYTGREPMGPLWAMVPADGERSGSRLVKRDVTTPYNVRMQVIVVVISPDTK